MNIQLLQNVAHATRILAAKAVHDIEDAVAQSLIKRGLAKPADDPPASDAAASSPPATPPAAPKASPKPAK